MALCCSEAERRQFREQSTQHRGKLSFSCYYYIYMYILHLLVIPSTFNIYLLGTYFVPDVILKFFFLPITLFQTNQFGLYPLKI